VPVTVYVLNGNVGETVALPPGIITKLAAPEGWILKEVPWQIVPLLTVMDGSAFTVTDDTAVFDEMQPKEEVPVTE
jgi:hypothetical protein